MGSFEVIALGTCYVDTNLEDYPFSSTGIHPEAELVGGRYEIVAGGSAVNFCRCLGNFGLKAAFMGVAGEDANGDSLEMSLRAEGITSLLVRDKLVLTNTSFNMTNPEGQHIMLVAGTANASLSGEMVLPKLREVVNDTKMVYLGGCFKLKGLAPDFNEVVSVVREHDKALVVDHGRIPQDVSVDMKEAVRQLARGSRYYLPSRDEFCALWEVGSIQEGIRYLRTEAPDLTVVVKDGANGAWYYENGAVQHAPAQPVEKVVDVTGVGDNFNAGFMAAVDKGQPVAEAVQYACRVGAAKVSGQPIPQLD